MKKLLPLILLLCAFPAFGQVASYFSRVVDSAGHPVANALIQVCTGSSSAGNCTFVTIYSDYAETMPINQATSPLVSAFDGQYFFYTSASPVTILVTARGSTQTYSNVTLSSSMGTTGITSINGDTTAAQHIAGSGIISASTSSGTTTIHGSAVTSINADTTAAQIITGMNGITVSTSGGTTTIDGSGGAGVPVPLNLVAGNSITNSIFTIAESSTGTFSNDAIMVNMLSTGTGSFTGNYMDMQLDGTSFWKLTNAGTTIQVGTMYSKKVDTTLIADMYCNTPFTLDDSCISNAISALPSTGGIINLSAGVYSFTNTVSITKPVILQGAGTSTNCTQSGCTIEPPYKPATEFQWNGSSSATMISVTPSGSNEAVGPVNLNNISLDANGISNITGVDANCLQFSQWNSVSIDHANVGLVLECRTGSNSMLNTFTQLEINLAGIGIVLDGPYSGSCSTTCGDAFNNTFIRTHIVYTGTEGLNIASADNNQFMDLTIYRNSGSGAGINFAAPTGSGTTARLGGTYEYIYHYQPPTTNGAIFSAGGNVIHEWDIANGQALPSWTGSPNHNFVSITNGTSTTWVTDTGGVYLYDPNPADTAPQKGLVVNNGHFQLMSNNHANVLLDIDDSGNTEISSGTNIVYRCATAGSLAAGALTITSGDCGTSTDTGLRVK